MKKTFTFLATVVLMTTVAFAQNNGNHQRDNNYGTNANGRNNPHDVVINDNHRRGGYDDRGSQGYYVSERKKNMQIAQINKEYFHRIQSVKSKFFMGRHQKERIINSLQAQRESEIRSVLLRFNDRDNRYDRRYDRYDDHDRKNWK